MHSPPVQPIAREALGDRRGDDDVARDHDDRSGAAPGCPRPRRWSRSRAARRRPRRASVRDPHRAARGRSAARACARGCARRAPARRAAARGRAPPAGPSPPSRSSTPAQVHRRAGAARDLLGLEPLERLDAEPLAERDDAVPRADLRGASSPSTASRPGGSAASIPCASQNSPISPIAASEARATRTASSSPQSRASEESFGHQQSTKPPLRPDAPPPQTSCSSTTTSQAGSCSLMRIAVHRPTKPPPTMATSARAAPSSGGASGRVGQRLLQPERAVRSDDPYGRFPLSMSEKMSQRPSAPFESVSVNFPMSAAPWRFVKPPRM